MVAEQTVFTVCGKGLFLLQLFLQAGQLAGFLTPGAVTPVSFKMPDGAGSAIPEGSYMLQEFSFRDQQNGYTDVEVTYRMCQKWELIKL